VKGRAGDTEEDLRVLREAVLAYALRLTRSRPRAEELTQEALLLSMTTRAWNPAAQPVLLRHLFGIVKSLRWSEDISARPRYEADAGHEEARLAGGAAASPEASTLEHARRAEDEARAAQQVEALRARLTQGGHELELSVCDLMAEGTTKPKELAERTGRPYTEVDAAIRRVRRYAKSIEAREPGEDEEVAQ
jgi:DNA-directed RNA polymerase specialized sigma24 family protein